jgi:zinc transport system ATP-binding protein
MKEDNCIDVIGINYKYNGNTILENIEFSVPVGEYMGIIGPNGGGKTTLIRIMLGLLKPETGQVKFFGRPVEDFRERHLIGYVPQRAAHEEFYFPATVEEIVKSGRTSKIGLLRRYSAADKLAVTQAMEAADIIDYRKRLIAELSGGERQRVFIARAMAGEPKILILDEPEVGVDIVSKDRFHSFLKHLNKDMQITILFISHDVGAIAHEVSDILCLNIRLICHGSPKQYIKEDFLAQVYGKKVKSIYHDH